MLSPIEIKKQEFSRAMRGYDAAEVRSFLETIADEFELLTESVRTKTSEVETIKSELVTYKRIEQNMKEALVTAQETLRDARDDSRREADLIKKEAQFEAERIITAAYKKGEGIRREIEILSERRTSIIRKLKALLRSELELIEMLEDDKINPKVIPNLKKES